MFVPALLKLPPISLPLLRLLLIVSDYGKVIHGASHPGM